LESSQQILAATTMEASLLRRWTREKSDWWAQFNYSIWREKSNVIRERSNL